MEVLIRDLDCARTHAAATEDDDDNLKGARSVVPCIRPPRRRAKNVKCCGLAVGVAVEVEVR